MKIVVKWIDDINAEVKVKEREKILAILRELNVFDAERCLQAWLDYITGDATVFQVDILRRNEDAVKFLDSITVVEE